MPAATIDIQLPVGVTHLLPAGFVTFLLTCYIFPQPELHCFVWGTVSGSLRYSQSSTGEVLSSSSVTSSHFQPILSSLLVQLSI